MFGRFKRFITDQDQTGAPVSLNYNGSETYQTFSGGCCSLVIVIITLLIIVTEFLKIFIQKEFAFQEEVHYLPYSYTLDEENQYDIPSSDLIPAILLVNRNRELDSISDYYFFQTFTYTRYKDEDHVF